MFTYNYIFYMYIKVCMYTYICMYVSMYVCVYIYKAILPVGVDDASFQEPQTNKNPRTRHEKPF